MTNTFTTFEVGSVTADPIRNRETFFFFFQFCILCLFLKFNPEILNILYIYQYIYIEIHRDFPGGSDCKESACSAGDLEFIPGSERSPRDGSGYACMHTKWLQLCLTLRPFGLHLARLLCPWGFSRQEYWNGLPCPTPGEPSQPRN